MNKIMGWVSENRTKALRLLWWILPILMFAHIFGVTLGFPLNDPDMWWHIKTGEYIVTNWIVPEVDPFAYTTNMPLEQNKLLGLRSQWLGQVIFFEVYNYFGLIGLGLFRNIMILLPMLFVYIWLISKRISHLSAMAITFFSLYVYGYQLFYSFERPQGMSFALAALTIILIERVREKSSSPGKDYSYFALPIVMMFWANVHAGYLVGCFIISSYFCSEIIRSLYFKLRKKTAVLSGRIFYIVGASSIAATFFTPNGPYLFLKYLKGTTRLFMRDVATASTKLVGGTVDSGSWVENVVLEFKPLKFFYEELGYDWLVFYWALAAIVLAFMLLKFILKRKFDLAEFATFSVIVFFAEQHARLLMFSIAILPVYMGKNLIEVRNDAGKLFMSLRVGIYASMIVLSMGFATYMLKTIPFRFDFHMVEEWISPWYPLDLVKFIKNNKIEGPMYNYYTWGGFFIWGLYPEHRVFIDGRAMDDMVNRTADSILKTFPDWESKLNVYGINFIAIPVVYRESGHIIPLGPALVNNPNWKLIYIRNNSALFVRDIPKNSDLIYRYSVDKNAIYKEIISVENLFLMGSPEHPVFNISKADALFMLGEYQAAKAIYERFPEISGPMIKTIREIENNGR